MFFVVFCFLFIYLCQLGQGHHNSICQLLWAFLPNPPCQLSLWEETGLPGGNPRLSAERWLLIFSHEEWDRVALRMFSLRLEPVASEVKSKCTNHLATVSCVVCRVSCIVCRVFCVVCVSFCFLFFIYLALPTRAGSPQQHMPITVCPFCPSHPVNFPCGRKPECP